MSIQVAVIGAAGYTGGEALDLLLGHPEFEVTYAQSRSQAGKLLHEVHPRLLGRTDLRFRAEPPAADRELDAWIVCTGHGRAKAFLEAHPPLSGTRVVDLSTDFRADGGHGFVYGLPEAFSGKIKRSKRVANPGCFATAIQLSLLPVAAWDQLKNPVTVTAITGSTGAGQAPSPTTHFSWRAENLSVYKTYGHQHVAEIRQTLRKVAGVEDAHMPKISFVPVRGDFARGIFCVTQMPTDLSQDQATEAFRTFYADAALTFVTDAPPDLQQVVRTNKALVHPIVSDGQLCIISILDNLRKGASSQAIENLNLMFGLDGACGLL